MNTIVNFFMGETITNEYTRSIYNETINSKGKLLQIVELQSFSWVEITEY